MNKRITDISNLVEAIETGLISVVSVEGKTEVSTNITETAQITLDDFITSIQLLNKTIFKGAIEFFYEFTSKNNVRLEFGIKNIYVEEHYFAECVIKEGISIEDINKKLRETIFDRTDKNLQCR